MRNKYNHLYLLFFWFFPIFITVSTSKFEKYGLEYVIVYLLAISIAFGGIFTLIRLNDVKLSVKILIVIGVIFGSMLLSDVTEIKLVSALAIYSVVVHAIARRFPLELWQQYYFVCIVLSWMTIIEIFAYFLFGDFVFSYRDPRLVSNFMPRVTPVFDEMAHQAFFIMPAAIVAFNKNKAQFALLFCGVLLPFSVAAIVLFTPLLVYFSDIFKYISIKKNIFLITVAIFITLIVLTSSDLIYSKFYVIFSPELLNDSVKSASATNILVGLDLMSNINMYDLLTGFGYFVNRDEWVALLSNSKIYDYYYITGVLDDNNILSVGLINLIMYFGLILVGMCSLLLYKSKKYAADELLYSIAIIITFGSMLKNSHTVDYFVHLFFIFGLAWSSRVKTFSKQLKS